MTGAWGQFLLSPEGRSQAEVVTCPGAGRWPLPAACEHEQRPLGAAGEPPGGLGGAGMGAPWVCLFWAQEAPRGVEARGWRAGRSFRRTKRDAVKQDESVGTASGGDRNRPPKVGWTRGREPAGGCKGRSCLGGGEKGARPPPQGADTQPQEHGGRGHRVVGAALPRRAAAQWALSPVQEHSFQVTQDTRCH